MKKSIKTSFAKKRVSKSIKKSTKKKMVIKSPKWAIHMRSRKL
jgi:hypothetical protein